MLYPSGAYLPEQSSFLLGRGCSRATFFFLTPFPLLGVVIQKRNSTEVSHPKSHSEQGEAQKKKKKIASLIMPHAISQSEGFAPVLDSSALGYKN